MVITVQKKLQLLFSSSRFTTITSVPSTIAQPGWLSDERAGLMTCWW